MDHSNPYAQKPLVSPKSNPSSGTDKSDPGGLPRKYELPKKPDSDFSLFKSGESRKSVRELTRRLEKDPQYRHAIAEKYGKKWNDPFVDKFIKDEAETIRSYDLNDDGFVDRNIEVPSKRDEVLHPGQEANYQRIREMLKEREGGIDAGEVRVRKTKEDERGFFKKLFGIR